MIKLLKITDIHFYDKNPTARLDDYNEALLDKIRQVSEYVVKNEIDGVLFCGDLFHDQAASRVSHLLVNKVLNALKSIPCPIYGIAGNHDLSYQRIDSLGKQPLGVIISSGVIHLLDNNPVTLIKDDLSVEVHGISYLPDQFEMILKAQSLEPKSKYSVLCLHCIVTEKGSKFFHEDTVSYKTLTDMPFNVFALGHFHQDTEIIPFDGNKFICNSGSLSRGSLSTDNITRIPKMELYTFDKDKVKCSYIELDVKPSSEIFDLVKREEVKQEVDKIKEFVATLSQGEIEVKNDGGDIGLEILKGVLDGVIQEVRVLVLKYLVDCGLNL